VSTNRHRYPYHGGNSERVVAEALKAVTGKKSNSRQSCGVAAKSMMTLTAAH
jgi:predicted aldo/keto reductase-like oxidoreductase